MSTVGVQDLRYEGMKSCILAEELMTLSRGCTYTRLFILHISYLMNESESQRMSWAKSSLK
jgi:hypothetical protein